MAPSPSNHPQPLSPQPLPSPRFWSQSPVSLPSSPGVYWFLDADANVLYVGKAKNLSHRLKSYARLNHLLPKTRQLIEKANSVKYQILDSELQALLIEAELIRLHQPPYNILLKDDKSPLYIVITQETYPKVLPIRRSDLKTIGPLRRIFGPFPSSRQVKSVLQLARRLFPYCNASHSNHQHRRACFYYHLGLCPGACLAIISPQEYQHNIKHLELFLAGKHQHIIKQLKRSIRQFSAKQQYEQAQTVKDKLQSLEYINTHYRLTQQHQPLPQLSQDQVKETLLSLKNLLHHAGLNITSINRIEAYDVANIMGQSTAVSMVVATRGVIDKSQYRHFAIKSFSTPNDVGMLQEAIIRRQQHPEWGIPDLMVIDGGKTQVNGVKTIMQWSIPIIGIAKHPDRLYLSPSAQSGQYFVLDPTLPGTKLILQLRDEAHRFSRRLHHRLDLNKLFR